MVVDQRVGAQLADQVLLHLTAEPAEVAEAIDLIAGRLRSYVYQRLALAGLLESDLEDVGEGVFVELLEYMFRQTAKFRMGLLTYGIGGLVRLLGRMADRAGRRAVRRAGREPQLLQEDPEADGPSGELLENLADPAWSAPSIEPGERERFWAVVAALDRDQCVRLSAQGYSHEEIAERLGITPQAAKQRAYRVKQALREELLQQGLL